MTAYLARTGRLMAVAGPLLLASGLAMAQPGPGYGPGPAQPGVYPGWGPTPAWQPAAPPPPPYPPPPPPPPPEPRVHDGFYLRLGMGIGVFDDSAEVETFVREYGVNTRGGTLSLEVSLGGGIQPGIALAGTYLLDIVPSPRIRQRGVEHEQTDGIMHDLLGPSIDIYPDPEGGFHAGMTVGYATLSIDDATRGVDDAMAEGIGLAPHVGYSWWTNGAWCLGVLGRFRYAHMEADVNDGLPTGVQRDSVVVGTLELAATLF